MRVVRLACAGQQLNKEVFLEEKGLSLNVEILLIFQSENETCPKVRSKPSSKEALPGILLLPLLAPSAATIWATNRAE